MNRCKKFVSSFLYVALAVALLLSAWSFARSDQQWKQLYVQLSQTSELQSRAYKLQEKLTQIIGYLRLAIVSGEESPRLHSGMIALRTDMQEMLSAGYLSEFLGPKDIDRLAEAETALRTKYIPVSKAQLRYDNVLLWATSLKQTVSSILGGTTAKGQNLGELIQIDAQTARYKLMFGLAFTAFLLMSFFVYQRIVLARQQSQYMRSLSFLYAHMTRTRVVALRMFIDQWRETGATEPENLELAGRAARKLEAINVGLLKTTYSGRQMALAPLQKVLDELAVEHPSVKQDASADALKALVSIPQLPSIVDELVRNAELAARPQQEPEIAIRANLSRRWFSSRQLVLEVVDDGIGMDKDVLSKATDPFFSTHADSRNSHVGMGLTSCFEVIKMTGGTLRIKSVPGQGTTVRIVCPL